MEYLNRIVEADRKSKSIIEEFSQTKANSYNGLQSEVTFDEFNVDKGYMLQSKLQDLQTMVEYYEQAYRNVDTMSGDQFTKISDYLKVEDVKEELNRRVNNLKGIIKNHHYEI